MTQELMFRFSHLYLRFDFQLIQIEHRVLWTNGNPVSNAIGLFLQTHKMYPYLSSDKRPFLQSPCSLSLT